MIVHLIICVPLCSGYQGGFCARDQSSVVCVWCFFSLYFAIFIIGGKVCNLLYLLVFG